MRINPRYKEWFILISIAILLSITIRSFLFEIYIVDGLSMEPTLKHNERIIVTKVHKSYNRGDIVVIDFSKDYGKDIIKRILAVEGDTIEIHNGMIIINGIEIKEDYLSQQTEGSYDLVKVPKEKVFVMGDNRNHSLDSRDVRIGFVDVKQIKGKAALVIYPVGNWRSLNNRG